jgi:hypothetical protein
MERPDIQETDPVIRSQLERVLADLDAARNRFSEMTAAEAIDAAIYELNAAEYRLQALLRFARFTKTTKT